MSTDAFLSFEWTRGLPPAQVLHAALCSAAPTARLWFALEQEAASPQQMEAGVASARVFVFLATEGSLLKANVRHEVACAVALGKRVLVLQEAEGAPPLEAVLAQGEGYAQADPAGDAAAGRRHLEAGALAAFGALARATPALPPLHRDARLASETAPALLAALGVLAKAPWRAPPVFRMRALRPLPGCSDALLVASSAGAMQALYLAQACSAACRGRQLQLCVLPAGASAAEAALAVGKAAVLVIVLTKGVWDCQGVHAAALAAVARKSKVVLVHEAEAKFGGQQFDDIHAATPGDVEGLFASSGVATVFRRNKAEAEVMVGGLVERLGGVRVERPVLPPPPLPGGYNAAPFAAVRAAVLAALGSSPMPAAVIVGGLGGAGKTTLASALALEEETGSRFDEVVWVTVGKVDHGGMVGVLHKLLDALKPPGTAAAAAAVQSKDPLTSAVQRLRAVCARRAVLLVLDDVWKPQDAWAPDAAALLCAAVDVAPEDGGRASAALFTCRDLRVFESFGEGVRGRVRVGMGEIEASEAAAYFAQAARLKGVPEMGALLAAVGRLPISLTLAAACVRDVAQSTTEEEAVEAVGQLVRESGAVAGPVKLGAWLEAAEFVAALQEANAECGSAEYAPIYRALQAALVQTIARGDWLKFAAFGLFEEEAYLPEGGLAVLWGCSVEGVRILLTKLQESGLVKWEAQAGRAVLHDLAHDFAVAMVRVGRGGLVGAAAAAVDKCAELVQEEGEAGVWWRREVGSMLRMAGRGAECTELVWGLQWLIRGVRERGAGALTREVSLQVDWENAQGEGRQNEQVQIELLQQMLVIAAQSFEGREGSGNIAPHVIGRLGGLPGARIERLIEEAMAWDGEGRPWLRPLRPNFPQPGGACKGVMEGHTSRVFGVCALGNERIVSGSEDMTLRVWDIATGTCVRVLEGHTRGVNCVCAIEDGRIASGSGDGTLRLWDAATGVCIKELNGNRRYSVSCICALGDGRIVSGVFDALKVWDVSTGVCLRELKGHTHEIGTVCSLGDGRIVSGSADKTLRVWDVAAGECMRVLEGHRLGVTSVCVVENGRIVSGSDDKTLRWWNLATGECERARKMHNSCVKCLCSVGNGLIVSGSNDFLILVWNAATGDCVGILLGQTRCINSVSSLGNGRIVSGSNDMTVTMWDVMVNVGKELVGDTSSVKRLDGHECHVNSLCTIGEKILVSGSNDGTVRVWDVSKAECIQVLKGHTRWVHVVHALKDGRVVSGSWDSTLRIWDVSTGECLHVLNGYASVVCELENGLIVSGGSADKALRVWDTATGLCKRLLLGHKCGVYSLCALKNDRCVSGSNDNTLRVWDAATGVCEKIMTGHFGSIDCVYALGDGRIISGSTDKTLRVWDMDTGECLLKLEGYENSGSRITACVRVLEDGCLSRFEGRTLKLWNTTSGEILEVCKEKSFRGSVLSSQAGSTFTSAYPHTGRNATYIAPLGALPLHLSEEASTCSFTTLPSGTQYVTVFLSFGVIHFFTLINPVFLRACLAQAMGETSLSVAEDAAPALSARATAAAMALTLPEPRVSEGDLLAARAALQSLMEQALPVCAPGAVFGAPYFPAIAALSSPARVVLLRACDFAALPEPTLTVLTACIAQHYASLPLATFEAEVAAPSPRCGALVRAWWAQHFEAPRREGNSASCYDWLMTGVLPLPQVGFGLDQHSPDDEFWVRGLDKEGVTPPRNAALLALPFGHLSWVMQHLKPCAELTAAMIRLRTLGSEDRYTTSAIPCLPRVVQLLGEGVSSELQSEASWILINMTNVNIELTQAVIDAGALPHLVRLLSSPDAEVQENAVWVLGNIAYDTLGSACSWCGTASASRSHTTFETHFCATSYRDHLQLNVLGVGGRRDTAQHSIRSTFSASPGGVVDHGRRGCAGACAVGAELPERW